MPQDLLRKIKRGLRKPPHVILRRIITELKTSSEKYTAPRRTQKLDLLKATNFKSISELWNYLGQRPYPTFPGLIDISDYEKLCPQNREKILTKAQCALEHKVDLLGSGLIQLGENIDWHRDYKSGFDWPPNFIRDINYNNPERPSDVKFPWEVSRLQWLIPAGQAYLLTHDEKYAVAVKNILEHWIDNNPYAYSINWTCTMEVALRIISWSWFFHVFHQSTCWQDPAFQKKFLQSLFLHVEFTARHLEYSDVNGNHYTADAAGLVFGGLFFGQGKLPQYWQKLGWNILTTELPKQIFPDGVNYEASVAYHRLVLELFLFPAFYREVCQLDVPESYRHRLIAMARFTAAYTKPNGLVPLWGDADDARALPLGDQEINDHRYLCGLIGAKWQVPDLIQASGGPANEIYWLLGPDFAQSFLDADRKNHLPTSASFPEGGFYIMRNARDHVFIDCGPLGLAGRGGHGHNDCLSFEAVLDGEPLITDCGAYLYTASYQERNHFRSTAYHNTPQLNDEEINRFIRWDYLWNLHNDAKPIVHHWETNEHSDRFIGSHTGYDRLGKSLKRTFILDHQEHHLTIKDEFRNCEQTKISIPLHLAPHVKIETGSSSNLIYLIANNKKFLLSWESNVDWELTIENARVSPSYGVVILTKKIIWQTIGNTNNLTFTLRIVPVAI